MDRLLYSIILVLFGITVALRNFRVVQETVKVNITAPDIISDANIYIRKLNRTFDALNSTASFRIALNDSIFIRAQSFEWKGSRFQPSFLDTKLDFCKFLENPIKHNILFALFYQGTTKFGNFPTKCPIPPGHYYIYNLNVNAEAFPPYFPVNRYMFVVSVFYRDRMIFATTIRYRIESKSLLDA